MKKKILALVLCLVFCVPFVLTSCFGGNAGFDEVISSYRKDYKDSYDSYDYETFHGDVQSHSGKFFFTKETQEEEIMGEKYGYYEGLYQYYRTTVGTRRTDTYRVYDALSATVLYSATTTYCTYDPDYTYDSSGWTTELTNVSVDEWGEDLFIIKETCDYTYQDTTYTYKLYDETGYCQLSSSEENLDCELLDNLDKEAAIFDDALYLYDTETNVLTNVKSFKENSVRSFVEDLYQAYDKYVLKTDSDVYVFNSEFKQLYGTNFNKLSENQFDTDVKSHVLNNGNILVQIRTTLGSYADVHDVEYTVLVDGICYNVDTYLYEVGNGLYSEIPCDYIISAVGNSKDTEEYDIVGLPNEAENIAYVQKIENCAIVYVDNNDYSLATLSNDGDIQIVSHEDLGDIAVAITANRYIVEGEYFTRVYNERNEVVGEVGTINHFNKNFIVTDEAIYDLNLNSVVTLEDDKSYFGITNDTVIYKETTDNTIYYYLVRMDDYGYAITDRLTTSDNPDYSYKAASVTVNDRYIYVVETDYSSYTIPTNRTITFYQTNGTEIASYDLPTEIGSHYSLSTLDDCVVFAVKTTSGSYFVTLEKLVVEEAN